MRKAIQPKVNKSSLLVNCGGSGRLRRLPHPLPILFSSGLPRVLFGIPYIIPMGGPGGPLTAMPAALIIVFSAVPAVGATILLAILSKVASRPMRVFWVISVVVFVLSFVLPIGLPSSVATSTRIGLPLMHVIAAAVIVGVLTTLGRQK